MYMKSFNLPLEYGSKRERRVPFEGKQLRVPFIPTNDRTEMGQDKEEQFRSNILKPKKQNKSQVVITAFYK